MSPLDDSAGTKVTIRAEMDRARDELLANEGVELHPAAAVLKAGQQIRSGQAQTSGRPGRRRPPRSPGRASTAGGDQHG